jgi:hypothetical protein
MYISGNSYNCDNNHNCCVGCGPQEQFYGCADIAITSSGSHYYHPAQQQGQGQSATVCKATPMFKARYPYADRYCSIQCSQNKCPPNTYCTDACRRM